MLIDDAHFKEIYFSLIQVCSFYLTKNAHGTDLCFDCCHVDSWSVVFLLVGKAKPVECGTSDVRHCIFLKGMLLHLHCSTVPQKTCIMSAWSVII